MCLSVPVAAAPARVMGIQSAYGLSSGMSCPLSRPGPVMPSPPATPGEVRGRRTRGLLLAFEVLAPVAGAAYIFLYFSIYVYD